MSGWLGYGYACVIPETRNPNRQAHRDAASAGVCGAYTAGTAGSSVTLSSMATKVGM